MIRNSELIYVLKLLEEKVKLLEDKIVDLELDNYELKKRYEGITEVLISAGINNIPVTKTLNNGCPVEEISNIVDNTLDY